MSLTQELLRRLGQGLRAEVPDIVDESDDFMLEDFLIGDRDFTDCRLWLYRLCLFLPKELFHRSISLEATRTNVRSEFCYDLTYSAELVAIANICNRHSLSYGDAGRIACCFQLLLSSRGRVHCINDKFSVICVGRIPNWNAVQTIILEPVTIHAAPAKRTRQRR